MTRRVALVCLAFAAAACGGQSATSVDPGGTVAAPGTTAAPSDGSPSAAVTSETATSEGAPADDDRLPDIDLTSLTSGATGSLAQIEGPAVVNLWATWCAPCRVEIPDFEEVHRARGHEVRFIGVNVGEDADDARAFIDDVGATYDQFADFDGDVATALRAAAMPVTVVIDADGVITTHHLGPLDQDGLNEAIDEALGITGG